MNPEDIIVMEELQAQLKKTALYVKVLSYGISCLMDEAGTFRLECASLVGYKWYKGRGSPDAS